MLDIDPKIVRAMAGVHATYPEIADAFDCSEATIRARFTDIVKQERARNKIRLRTMQFKQAMKGDRTMLVWLGKVMLDQKEKTAVEHSGTDGTPMTVAVTHTIVDPGAS